MASKEETRMCRMIVGQAMEITAQGIYHVWAEYHGHVDALEVRACHAKTGEQVTGWGCNDRNVYLGDFYSKSLFGLRSKESMDQLAKLSVDLKTLVSVDEDGVPV